MLSVITTASLSRWNSTNRRMNFGRRYRPYRPSSSYGPQPLPSHWWRRHLSSYLDQRAKYKHEIQALPESIAYERLQAFLDHKVNAGSSLTTNAETANFDRIRPPTPPISGYSGPILTPSQLKIILDAALLTFVSHTEARIAALMGTGYYTIGPCGEETLASVAFCLQSHDTMALHYRHSSIDTCRQLIFSSSLSNSTSTSTMEHTTSSGWQDIILNRARGYSVSRHDPVTGGVHCSIGGGSPSNDSNNTYIVTSTLASQCSAAVGRALGFSVLRQLPHDVAFSSASTTDRPISIVTVGDGSVHNHHFWSAFHLARHARHQNIRCPVVFGVSDNGLSISYNTGGYVNTLWENDPLVPLYKVNGNDIQHVYSQTMAAAAYARTHSSPVVILYTGLVRRFGHAATDRQSAYLDQKEINQMAHSTVLESMIVQAVEVFSATTYSEIRDRLHEIRSRTIESFQIAASEGKVTRADMLKRVSAPLVGAFHAAPLVLPTPIVSSVKTDVMRKHMNRVIAESMQNDKSVMYLGEDVVHGGYYLVTEALAQQFPGRVIDFPPDETSLLGAAMGFAQLGLVPIVEIPYAKYLDCGADMFHEIALTYWLSAGKFPVGMIIRLQGFDQGVFGGNFHTSNELRIPPGVDVCCYSNGHDYVNGFRFAIKQAKAGRVVMFVDCTNLLNLRHLFDKDRGWETPYPDSEYYNEISFDSIRQYGKNGSWAIVTYGNGVVTSLQARKYLVDQKLLKNEDELDILDCFTIHHVPRGLKSIARKYEGIIFADICKQGPGNVLSSMVCSLRSEGLLPNRWELIAAPRTYNPLGSLATFLNSDDIVQTFRRMIAT